jgi:hypothetical protein
MAKHKTFDALKVSLNSRIKLAVSPIYMAQYGNKAAQLVKDRTRLGFGVSEEGAPREALEPLSDSYKKQRAGEIAFAKTKEGKLYAFKPKSPPKLSSFTSVGKSNLTNTGQMLDNIKLKSVSTGRATLHITGKRDGSKLTNDEVAGFVSEKRPFFHLSKTELKQIALLFQSVLRKIISSLD